jgi:hypothetical protein
MTPIKNVATIFCVLAGSLQAQVVVVNSNLKSPAPYGSASDSNLSFTVWQDAAATNWTGVWLK